MDRKGRKAAGQHSASFSALGNSRATELGKQVAKPTFKWVRHAEVEGKPAFPKDRPRLVGCWFFWGGKGGKFVVVFYWREAGWFFLLLG